VRIVGIIPARAGSQRLPGKNLAPLAGRPLIAWTCAAARAARSLTAVYVNTDCPRIAAVAAEHGVTAPALRPAHLATAGAPTRAANRWLLDLLTSRGQCYDAVLVLQPTSPLRTAADIDAAVALFAQNRPCAVVSVAPVAPSGWLGTVGGDGAYAPLRADVAPEAPVYRLNGAINLFAWDDYLHDCPPPRQMAYVMPPERSVDIDTHEDHRLAEIFCAAGHRE
jgi:CMP-N-acetylneuraminic acid synthetase